MLVLILFAFLAGAGTALSPCVLPVLPALLSAGGVRRAGGGRSASCWACRSRSPSRSSGVAKVVDGVGLGSDPLRDLAVVVLLVFGWRCSLPALGARIEAPLSRLARFGPALGAATASARACSSAARSASSTRRARARSWRP